VLQRAKQLSLYIVYEVRNQGARAKCWHMPYTDTNQHSVFSP